MTNYTFARLPSTASVSATVTLLVSAWFLVAGAAIVTEGPQQQTRATLAAKPAATAFARAPAAELVPATLATPDAHFTIVVEARRA